MISALVTAGLEGGYPLAGRLAARIEQDALHVPWIEDYLVDRLLHTVRARGRIAAMGAACFDYVAPHVLIDIQ